MLRFHFCGCDENRVGVRKASRRKIKAKAMAHAKQVDAIARKLEPKTVARIKEGLATFKNTIDRDKIMEFVEAGRVTEAVQMLNYSTLSINVADQMEKAMLGGSVAAAKYATLTGERFILAADNPLVKNYIDLHIGKLIQDIGDDARQSVTTVVSRTLSHGLTPKQAADFIPNTIGLTEKQTVRLMERHAKLLATRSDHEDELTRLNAQGLIASPRAGKLRVALSNLTDERIDTQISDAADRLEDQRAQTIARTELTRAVNGGQLETWGQAQDEGILPPTAVMTWIAVEDAVTTDICLDLDGQQAPIGGKFYSKILGTSLDAPPAHPNCRSVLGLDFVQQDTETSGSGNEPESQDEQ